jgi:hypothetical protein
MSSGFNAGDYAADGSLVILDDCTFHEVGGGSLYLMTAPSMRWGGGVFDDCTFHEVGWVGGGGGG